MRFQVYYKRSGTLVLSASPEPPEKNVTLVLLVVFASFFFVVIQSGGKNAPAGRSTIVHTIDTMESFSMLSIAPPPNKVGSSVGRVSGR